MVVLILVTGCSQSNAQVLIQQSLDGYAKAAASGSGLDRFLSGGALEAAEQGAALLADIGLSQLGSARFEVENVSDGQVSGCLDLSQVQVVDSSGGLLQPNRQERVGFSGRFASDYRLFELEVGGPC